MSTTQEILRDTGATELQAEGRAFLAAFYAGVRSLRLYPIENQAVQRTLAEVDARARDILRREELLSLRVAGDFVFINDYRLRLDLANYASFSFVRKALGRQGIGSIAVDPAVEPQEWTALLSTLISTPGEGPEALDGVRERLARSSVTHIEIGPAVPVTESEAVGVEAQQAARRTYARSVSVVREVMTSLRLGHAVSARRVKRVVLGIVDQVLQEEASMLGMTTLRDYDEYTFTHCVNLCILSVMLGQKLGMTKQQLFDLGLCALFHDIGKTRVPTHVLNKEGKLTEEEWKHMSRHPDWGLLTLFDVQGLEEPPYRAMLTAYEHHMKLDFSGYPRTIRKRRLGFFSRIVAVADAFDAATSKRSYQYIPYPPDEVLKELRDNPKRGFDRVVVKAFINMMGIFPVGTLGILDTGELGVVVAPNPNPEELHRPLIRVVSDPNGRRLPPGPIVDLSAPDPATGRPARTIIKTTDPERYGIRVADYVA